jgi:hypothetical protein
LDEISLAYAITIHKSQESEFPAVVIPVAMQQYMLLQRNLVYTGITRGQEAGGFNRVAEGAGVGGQKQPHRTSVFRAGGEIVGISAFYSWRISTAGGASIAFDYRGLILSAGFRVLLPWQHTPYRHGPF